MTGPASATARLCGSTRSDRLPVPLSTSRPNFSRGVPCAITEPETPAPCISCGSDACFGSALVGSSTFLAIRLFCESTEGAETWPITEFSLRGGVDLAAARALLRDLQRAIECSLANVGRRLHGRDVHRLDRLVRLSASTPCARKAGPTNAHLERRTTDTAHFRSHRPDRHAPRGVGFKLNAELALACPPAASPSPREGAPPLTRP